ncbi:thymidine phosphorylase [uncultured Ilyobacter sp.]|uniref:thymidine phosphorylase n=1 Tax=uncultured Ilyobacter sp. TaxID=544433 RepID=UPI0029F5648C|nr:thymidine phosphorylase [uncultured Ilyobacter sp.]
MRAVDIIQKKRDKEILTKEEIGFLLGEYLEGNIPDYQMSSFLMAVYFNGMTTEELKFFTEKMIYSGDTIDFPGTHKFLVDKHSTGGVGDKTTIALAPIFGALGMGTAKLSGKGLGHTGGTIDKFESIEGFKFSQTKEELIKLVNETGTGIMGYSDKIVPLDKKLYSLRDVTATVPSIPLIASSIMGKKLAVHADAIILDVKVGSGAFMKNIDEARELAKTMYDLGKAFDRNIVCLLTNMDQPLGEAVGNSLEVIEAIETLKGNGPEDFTDLIYTLASQALVMKGDAADLESGKERVKAVIENGQALDMLRKFIRGSGGNPDVCDDYSLLPKAREKDVFYATKDGYIEHLNAELIGRAAMMLGAGRAAKDDIIDHSVGIIMCSKVGDKLEKGDAILEIFHNGNLREEVLETLAQAVVISEKKIDKQEIILEIIGG